MCIAVSYTHLDVYKRQDVESAIVIFVVITMNAILGTVQTVKAEQSLNSLKQLSAPDAKVVRDGQLMQVPARKVTVGDEVIVEAGDLIPADGKLLTVASLKVDELSLIHIFSMILSEEFWEKTHQTV